MTIKVLQFTIDIKVAIFTIKKLLVYKVIVIHILLTTQCVLSYLSDLSDRNKFKNCKVIKITAKNKVIITAATDTLVTCRTSNYCVQHSVRDLHFPVSASIH